MRDLKSWAMLFCTISVLLGILQMILPQKEQSMGIKLMMGLYILITILKPAAGIHWSSLLTEPQYSVEQTAQMDFDRMVKHQSQKQLQTLLQTEFEQQGIRAAAKQVILEYDPQNNRAEVTAVVLQGQKELQAEQAARRLLGDAITVNWTEKDEAE